MGPHLSVRQYRNLDLFFWAVIVFLSELLINVAASRWYPDQLYTVSVTAAITAIVMIRWKGFAVIHAVVGGAAMCLSLGASSEQYLIYIAGNLLSVAALLFIRAVGEKKIRENAFWAMCYGICTLILMQTGRALVSSVLGYDLGNCIAFYTTDSLSLVFTAVILWIVRRLDGILEDQKKYLIRIHNETEMEKEETR